MNNSIEVKVPATSANLSCGFDSFGCALSLYDHLRFTIGAAPLMVTGIDKKYCNEKNTAVRAFDRVIREAHSEIRLERLEIYADIPFARGLGSSSALIAGGAFAANYFLGGVFSREDLVRICTELEGHPDNIAPAIYGGLTSSAMDGSKVITAHFGIDKSLRFIAMIPDYKVATAAARAVLPKNVMLSDAVFNISRTALLIKGIETGDEKLISFAMDDALHTPYRKSLINGYDKIRELALSAGAISFCISGSGPTMLAIAKDASVYPDICDAINAAFGDTIRIMELKPDFAGASY